MNVHFRDPSGAAVFYNGCAMAGANRAEVCAPPAGAAFAFVSASSGVNVNWVLTYTY